MTDERELDDGLAAFDQLGREMAETNRLRPSCGKYAKQRLA
jgi:hypothetical protein